MAPDMFRRRILQFCGLVSVASIICLCVAVGELEAASATSDPTKFLVLAAVGGTALFLALALATATFLCGRRLCSDDVAPSGERLHNISNEKEYEQRVAAAVAATKLGGEREIQLQAAETVLEIRSSSQPQPQRQPQPLLQPQSQLQLQPQPQPLQVQTLHSLVQS